MLIKRYRQDQDKVKVRCPVCSRIMSGWTKMREWDRYWISHQKPSKKACWATEEQMIEIKRLWEDKYEAHPEKI